MKVDLTLDADGRYDQLSSISLIFSGGQRPLPRLARCLLLSLGLCEIGLEKSQFGLGVSDPFPQVFDSSHLRPATIEGNIA